MLGGRNCGGVSKGAMASTHTHNDELCILSSPALSRGTHRVCGERGKAAPTHVRVPQHRGC